MKNPLAGRDPRLLIFDLDGTLVDSLADIAASVNAVRLAHGLPPVPVERVRGAIGAGARVLIRETCAADLGPGAEGAGLEALYQELLAQYRVYCVRDPQLYPGAREFLETASQSATLAVLTNKPLEIAELTLRAAGLEERFTRVLAPENAPRKPDPGGIVELMKEFGAARDGTVLFGDSGADFLTGRAAAILTVGLRGGYGHPGDPEPDAWAAGWGEIVAWWREVRK